VSNNTKGIIFHGVGSQYTLTTYNDIKYNNTGIRCDYYSFPLIFPHNRILDNDTGANIISTSAPEFGTSLSPGQNSISNMLYDIGSAYGGTIYAKSNWWGSYPANPLLIGTVDYGSALETDPNPLKSRINIRQNEPIVLGKSMNTGNSIEYKIPGMKEIDEARDLFAEGKYDEALNIFNLMINQYSDHLSGQIALIFTDGCLKKLKRYEEIKPILNNINTTKANKEISAVACMIEERNFILDKEYEKAINKCLIIINNFPNSYFEESSLYDLGTIYYYYLKDNENGKKYYGELVSKYPGGILSSIVLPIVCNYRPKYDEKSGKISEIAVDDVLGQNYPNPFNPSTTISYIVPVQGYVNLIVYDILGREIKKLGSTGFSVKDNR